MKVNHERGYNRTMNTNNVTLGYRVETQDGAFVVLNVNGEAILSHDSPPEPVKLADAHRQAASYLDTHPEAELEIVTVDREKTPSEKIVACMALQLIGLCRGNGLILDLTQNQVEQQLTAELNEFMTAASHMPK